MIRKSALAGLAAVVLLLGACGSGDDDDAATAADSRTEDQADQPCADADGSTTTVATNDQTSDDEADQGANDQSDEADEADQGNQGDQGDEPEGDQGDNDQGGDSTSTTSEQGSQSTCETTSSTESDDSGDSDDDGSALPGQGDEGAAPDTVTSDGDYTCEGGDVTVQGIGLNVGLTGECATVTINGTNNNIDVESAQTIELHGANHNLDYNGDPEVVDNSIDSNIN
jgi:hypothetical protein